MFLYARLVLDYLGSNIFYSGDEIKDSVNQLPEKLTDLWVSKRLVAYFVTLTLPLAIERFLLRSLSSWILVRWIALSVFSVGSPLRNAH